jgi:hypothetical protein
LFFFFDLCFFCLFFLTIYNGQKKKTDNTMVKSLILLTIVLSVYLPFFFWPLYCLYFFFWPLCYLFFFNIRILITPLIIFKLFFTPGVWWGPCYSSI